MDCGFFFLQWQAFFRRLGICKVISSLLQAKRAIIDSLTISLLWCIYLFIHIVLIAFMVLKPRDTLILSVLRYSGFYFYSQEHQLFPPLSIRPN